MFDLSPAYSWASILWYSAHSFFALGFGVACGGVWMWMRLLMSSDVIVKYRFHPWWFGEVVNAFDVGSDQVG